MNKSKAKILMLVEGEKTDFVLMQRLLDIYGVNEKHEIVSYNTNIYVLYNHMFAGGDPDSLDLLQELKDKLYKARVQKENRNHDYSKFARTREECNVIIRQNIEKAWRITGNNPTDYSIPVFTDILKAQVDKILKEGLVFVLCTCAFYIFDYNSTLIRDEGLR